MTTTLRGDGVVFPDGSLQVTARTSPPVMTTGSYGIGAKARPEDLDWASSVQPGAGVSAYHVATPYAMWQSGMLDVGCGFSYVGQPARAVGVTYVNTSTIPRMVQVATTKRRFNSDIAI